MYVFTDLFYDDDDDVENGNDKQNDYDKKKSIYDNSRNKKRKGRALITALTS